MYYYDLLICDVTYDNIICINKAISKLSYKMSNSLLCTYFSCHGKVFMYSKNEFI